ncbi:MAG: MBL fold metallo-hydrolase, partial [Planctomycetota bacterium]
GVAAVPHVGGVGSPGLRVTFLDVGHGGATLIERPDGRAVLFDCGSLGDGSRAARAVGDALRARGLAGLDAVVISHPDADHDNGLTAVLKRHGVSSVVTTRRFLRSAEPVSIGTRAAVATAGVPITFAAAGDELDFGAGVTARVLAPGEEESSAEDRREVADNETSLVLAVTYAGRTVVLTGDIEGEPLTEMLGRTGPLDCEVLAAPHHGSPNVETGPMLAAYSPRIVVVSAGSRLARETVEAAIAGRRAGRERQSLEPRRVAARDRRQT